MSPVTPGPGHLEPLTIIGMEMMETKLKQSTGEKGGMLVDNDNEIIVLNCRNPRN